METTLSALSILPTTKKESATFANMAINEILMDGKNAMEFDIRFKMLEDLIKLIRKDSRFKEAVIAELLKYPEKTVSFRGVDFTKKTTRTYFYETDSKWTELKNQINELDEKRKDREAFLKTLKDPVVDPETGEFVNPIRSQETETYSVKIN